MTFRSLALSSIRGNWRSYGAFFMSSVFSVMIFYIYAAFLAHPEVASGRLAAAAKVRQGMVFCEYVIVIFSFLFVLYSNSAFLKTRQQEFGLLSLFGMTRGQLRKLVLYENAAIAALSVGAGIGLGILFSKLFFMGLGVLLGMSDTIPFAVPQQAVWLTAGGFFLLFMLISVWAALRMSRAEIADRLKASRKPKGQLVYSRRLALLAAVCLGAGYSLALTLNEAYFAVDFAYRDHGHISFVYAVQRSAAAADPKAHRHLLRPYEDARLRPARLQNERQRPRAIYRIDFERRHFNGVERGVYACGRRAIPGNEDAIR